MKLTEDAEHRLRTELERAGAAGMKPRRRLAGDGEIVLVEPERDERSYRVLFRTKHIRRGRFARPMASGAGTSRMSEPDAGRCEELIPRPRAAIGLAKLEQSTVGEAPI